MSVQSTLVGMAEDIDNTVTKLRRAPMAVSSAEVAEMLRGLAATLRKVAQWAEEEAAKAANLKE